MIVGALVLPSLLLPMSAAADPVFKLDTPADGAIVAGIVEVSGWILDDGQSCGSPANWQACDWTDALISNIDLYVDGVFIASADLSIARYDVIQAYPWYAGTPFNRPGFSTSFNADQLIDGTHSLFLRVTFADMTVTDYGHRHVEVDKALNQAPFGELELPQENQPMNGVYPITGWALDEGSLEDVEILIDGQTIGHANTGMHRPDVGNRFPSHEGSDYAGFQRFLNTSRYANGVHILAVRLRDNEGASRVIGRRFVHITNVGHNLPPFGAIDWPIADHTMYSYTCSDDPAYSYPDDTYEVPENIEMVAGWALDIGSGTDTGGVKYVQLLIDGVLLSDTLIDDEWLNYFDMMVNYYGYDRLDIEEMFPDVINAKHSGFVFAVDVGYLLDYQDFHEGLHWLKIRAGDQKNNVTDIAEIPVLLKCWAGPNNDPGFGDILTPEDMEIVSGVTPVNGWAIDFDTVWEVEIWVDGQYKGYATYGLSSDYVEEMFPWYPDSRTRNAGFYYELDTTTLTDGQHRLVVNIEDRNGNTSILGERDFIVDNLN